MISPNKDFKNQTAVSTTDRLCARAISYFVGALQFKFGMFHDRLEAADEVNELCLSSDEEDKKRRALVHGFMRDGVDDPQQIYNTVLEAAKGEIPYAITHRQKREVLIESLQIYLKSPYSESEIAAYLTYTAERAMLIDVPDKPDSAVQPLYQPYFTDIDVGLADHDFFKHLVPKSILDMHEDFYEE